MKDEYLFDVEIEELNRGNRTERLLDDILNLKLQSDSALKPPLESTREIVELFLQVVRRRNNLRRNWHPQESIRCDLVVLDRIEKKGVIARVNIKLDEVISHINGGDSSKALETIQKIKKELNQGISEGQADIARTVRKSPLKNEIREIVSRIDGCTFNDLLDGLRAKQGGGVIVNVYDDAVEQRDPEKPTKLPKHTSYSRLRDIFTEVKRELKK
jgi:hypothetical protein